MTRQEIFDKVKAHLLKQNARSTGASGSCRYRGEHGRMCAVGCLISDAKYRTAMEGHAARDLRSWLSMPSPRTLALLDNLQDVHDGYEPRLWSIELADVAKRFGLRNTEVSP